MSNWVYPCQCDCVCEQGYDYQPATICTECGNGEHQNNGKEVGVRSEAR